MKFRGELVVRLIAVFRLLKAFLLILGGIGVLRLHRPGIVQRLLGWVNQSQSPIVHRAIAKVLSLSPMHVDEVAVATFLYAALFATEGVGLWMGRAWAEWLTIVATTSFIPFEVYEVVKKASAVRVSLLVVNIAIVIYLLILRLRARRVH